MDEDNKKWLKVLGCIVLGFVIAYLSFYVAVVFALHKFFNPEINPQNISKDFDKMIQRQNKEFRKLEKTFGDNPFEPKIRPMLVNLVKENGKYLIIVDLKQIDGDENGIDIKIKDNIISVKGEFEESSSHGEKILDFSQSYYVDEKLDTANLTKEKKGNKYIITIPFKS